MSTAKQNMPSRSETSGEAVARPFRPPLPLIAAGYRRRRGSAERLILDTFDPVVSLRLDGILQAEEFFSDGRLSFDEEDQR